MGDFLVVDDFEGYDARNSPGRCGQDVFRRHSVVSAEDCSLTLDTALRSNDVGNSG